VRFLVLGSVLAGMVVSTSSWGLIALAPVGVAWLVRQTAGDRGRNWRGALASLSVVPIGAAAGYLLGSFETFVFWDAFEAAFRRTAGMHNSGGFNLPVHHLTTVSFYAFIRFCARWRSCVIG
jgi:hypothetical protein